jgi:sugar diacid utilization regulator
VEMMRVIIDVVEAQVPQLAAPGNEAALREAVLRYTREVAFAAAQVYARTAEARGAWDARLEALVVDSLLRGEGDETISSRASALGWDGSGHVLVMMGGLGDTAALEQVRKIARDRKLDCLCAVQGDRLVVVLGGVDRTGRPAPAVADAFAPGPVVIGPVVGSLTEARVSADAAHSALRVAHGWLDAPRPVHADDLLPERALAGDETARQALIDHAYRPLAEAGTTVLETLETYLAQGTSIEATARALFVHPNTVRYRLKRVLDATGLSPANPRDSYVLRLALTVGRLDAGDL